MTEDHNQHLTGTNNTNSTGSYEQAPDNKHLTIEEEISTIHIESETDWCRFVDNFNNKYINYADDIQITVSHSFHLSNYANYSLGTEENPFDGKIDFCHHDISYREPLVANASSVEICNINIMPDLSTNVSGSLIKHCTETAKIYNVLINCGNPKGNTNTMFFDSCVLVANGYEIDLSNIKMSNAIISQYDNVSGLIGSCSRLSVNNLNITSSMIHAQCGHLVTDAALIVRSADEISLSDVHVKNSAVSAIHYASGCAIECRKIAVTNTTYENCFVYVYPNATLPGTVSGLVTRNLEELYIDHFNPQNFILSTGDLNNKNSGVITGDCSNEYYTYRP